MLAKFKTIFNKGKRPKHEIWVDNISSWLGGLAIISIAVLAFPFTILIILWIVLRPKRKDEVLPKNYPKHQWELLYENEEVKVERCWNHNLEQLVSQSTDLAHDLEMDEFIAYSVRTFPTTQALSSNYFDFPMLQTNNGCFLISIDPLRKTTIQKLYFLDDQNKQLNFIADFPSGYEINLEAHSSTKTLLKGHNTKEQFELIIEAS